MKVVRVQYTVQPGYAGQNRENVAAVMQELHASHHDGVRYAVYLKDDGKTFMHLGHFKSADDESVLTSLEAFIRFRTQLTENLEIAPMVETFVLAHASWTIFEGPADAGG
jgi:hypothetical protein